MRAAAGGSVRSRARTLARRPSSNVRLVGAAASIQGDIEDEEGRLRRCIRPSDEGHYSGQDERRAPDSTWPNGREEQGAASEFRRAVSMFALRCCFRADLSELLNQPISGERSSRRHVEKRHDIVLCEPVVFHLPLHIIVRSLIPFETENGPKQSQNHH